MEEEIRVAIDVPAYEYLSYPFSKIGRVAAYLIRKGYLEEAINKQRAFKYDTVYQKGARFSGKTGAGSIAMIRAIIEAWRRKQRIVEYLYRMLIKM